MTIINGKDYARLKALLLEVKFKHPNARWQYKQMGASDMRYIWDTFHFTSDFLQINKRNADYDFLRSLYDYAKDEHITTALKSILLKG